MTRGRIVRGRIVEVTRVHRAAAGVATPFLLALIQTEEGLVLAVGDHAANEGEEVEILSGPTPRFVRP